MNRPTPLGVLQSPRVRACVWAVATVGVLLWAFGVGTDRYDRRTCGPDASDCDLGFLGGAAWAAVALLVMLLVVAGTELWLRRRARPGVGE